MLDNASPGPEHVRRVHRHIMIDWTQLQQLQQLQPSDRFDEQGAFFVKGLIGLVVLAIVYTILKKL